MNEGKLAEAETYFRKAAEQDDTYAEALGNLGTVLESQRQFAQAVECYDRAVALDGEFVDAHWNRGLLRLRQGDY